MAARMFPKAMSLFLVLFLVLVLVTVGGRTCNAQARLSVQEPQSPSISTEALLHQMTEAAGVVFVGEVVVVRRPAGSSGSGQNASEGAVTVEFRVEQAVRGCTAGSMYTLREWSGLWTGGDRYRVGQRLLVFLHKPDANGLSSPVGGKAGIVPLRGGGRAPGPYDTGADASEWMADLRWVQVQALRERQWVQGPQTTPVWPARPIVGRPRVATAGDNAAAIETDAVLPVAASSAHWVALPLASGSATQPLSQVLNLCRGWMRASDGAL